MAARQVLECGRFDQPKRGGAVGPLAALCMVIGLLGSATAGAAVAAVGAAARPAPTVPVMVVLDASGSMNQDDAPGPRIDAAKAAVSNLVETLPADAEVGLQVYGTGTGSTDAEKAAGCADIRTVVPVGPLDPAAFKAQVGSVVAAGYTPIGKALRAAADALPNEGPRSIVLVSDGEDTCAPPAPCDVAKELAGDGIDLVIHTVGFKVDPTARDQLSCIANATGGTYSDADDASALGDAVERKVNDAITGYTASGTPVIGADQPSQQAPLLRPGQYVDTFDHGWAPGDTGGTSSRGTKKYYTVDITAGVTPYISATLVPPTERLPKGSVLNIGVDLTLLTTDGTRCGFSRGIGVSTQEIQQPVTGLLNGAAIAAPGQTEECAQDGVRLLQVERIGEAWTDRELPVELIVRREPPADASAVPSPADAGPKLPAPTHGSATPINGGNSFNEAPELASGATYSDSLLTGENRYYRVPVQWGQRLSYLLTPTGQAEPVLNGSAYARVEISNPVRDVVTPPSIGSPWFVPQPDAISGSTSFPARYTNREAVDSSKYSLDGDYYLRLSADTSALDETSAQGFLITVVVSGEVEAGPLYQPAASTATTTASAPPGTSASPATATPAPTVNGATSNGATSDPTAAADTTGANTTAANTTGTLPAADSDPAGPTWIYLVLAVVVLVAAALLLLLLRRSRASRPPHS